MSESKSHWLRNILIIPLVVGFILAFFTFVLPKLFEKEKELSYTCEPPSSYLSEETVGDLKIKINEVETKSLFAYKVEFWNSGEIPLKELPVRYVFGLPNINFQVLTVIHETEPKYEFGEIREEGSDAHSKRFVYSLLNPGEKVTVTFLCTGFGTTISFYSKLEGLLVKQVSASGTKKELKYAIFLSGIIVSFVSVIMSSFMSMSKRWKLRELRKNLQSLFHTDK